MTRFVAKRLALGLLVVVGVLILTFVIARVVPGDPAASWVGPHATPQELARAHHDLGLDKSVPAQIVDYLGGIVTGDWGVSIHTKHTVLSDLATRAPASVELVVAALLIALVLGIPLGLASARWRGRAPDLLVRLLSVAGVSMPVFWLALILQLLFFQKLGILPVAGQYDPNLDYTSPLAHHTHMVVVDALARGQLARPLERAAASGASGSRRRVVPARRHRADGARDRCSRRSAKSTCGWCGRSASGSAPSSGASR